MRAAFALLACLALCGPAAAQSSSEVGRLQLYVQQLEEKVRTLTGENERLTHELNLMRAQGGQSAPSASADPIGAVAAGQPRPAQPDRSGTQTTLGAPPRDLGSQSISPDDPLIAPDGAGDGGPVDLSALANGTAPAAEQDAATDQGDASQGDAAGADQPGDGAPGSAGGDQVGRTASLSGSPRDEYDLAYGYILTGDYGLAEQSFTTWLAHFPHDPQATDAQFWLGESRFQQRHFREAATAFLALYKAAPRSAKAPDALLKLGMSLSALGEKSAACATLAEVGRKYPGASSAVMGRVHAEAGKAGCS